MRKRHKQEKRPSGRDTARSFIEAIIAECEAFEQMNRVFRRMMKQEERNGTDE